MEVFSTLALKQTTANVIGNQLGFSEVKAELKLQDKLDTIKSLREQFGKVSMMPPP